LKDPQHKTIGIGTKIFLGGGEGYIAWHGTQHNPSVKRKANGTPQAPAGTLAVIGDLKQMKSEWLVGTSMLGYGTTISVGIGVPIPILNEDICRSAAVKDEDLVTQIVDYSKDYPNCVSNSLGEVSYAQLKTGKIKIKNKEVPTGGLSSYSKAREIADTLKEWIKSKKFFLTEPVAPLPGAENNYSCKLLKERPIT